MTDVITLLKDGFDTIKDDVDQAHDAEANFTQSMLADLRGRYPDRNVLIYHDTDTQTNLVNGVHKHVECDLGLGFTQGYEVWLFDSGDFTRAGDGGFINWAFSGNCVQDFEGSHATDPSYRKRDQTQ